MCEKEGVEKGTAMHGCRKCKWVCCKECYVQSTLDPFPGWPGLHAPPVEKLDMDEFADKPRTSLSSRPKVCGACDLPRLHPRHRRHRKGD